MSKILKTSHDWEKESNYRVLDADGWDRWSFEYSWFRELIDEQEFNRRLMESTVVAKRTPEALTSVEGLGGDTGTLPSRDNKETIQ